MCVSLNNSQALTSQLSIQRERLAGEEQGFFKNTVINGVKRALPGTEDGSHADIQL